jgi:hypothetical protein
MINPTINSQLYSSRPLFLVMSVIAITGMLAAATFAPDAQARGSRGGYNGPAPIDLGSAGNYKMLSGAAITAPGSQIYGNIGARAAITIPGTTIQSVAALAAVTPAYYGNGDYNKVEPALADLNKAYHDARSRTPTVEITGDLAGRVLKPGVYHSTAALSLGGATQHLTLDADHEESAVWIFQGDAAMNVAAGRRIILVNSADYHNVFWVMDGAITLGAKTVFRGKAISKAAITTGANTEIHGALMTIDGAITAPSSYAQ